ncbi:MAG: flagellar hook-associated protein FlgL [Nitrospinota bacterium]|nr:flagellar hook-associated protein FlgL [Nitrospinota bacterium]
MVMRITNQLQQSNALQNIFRITEDLFAANQRVATGKRINKPSDDPLGMQDTLTLRSSIAQIQQFGRNIDNNRLYLNTADTALDSVGLGITRARELAEANIGSTSSAQTRAMAALEIQSILDQTIQEANTQVKGHFIFGGTELLNAPYQANGSGLGAVYSGNSDTLEVEVGANLTIPITRPGSEVFGTDMNAALNVNTLLSDLNGGAGVPVGTFTITNRAGVPTVINTAGLTTVNAVITAINAAPNITASLNADGSGLLIADSTPSNNIIQSLTITEGSGNTAQSLGILSVSDGNIVGSDLNPVITAATLISDLDGGNGLTLGQIDIVNGALSATVDLSVATTVGDILTAINGAGVNVTASINSQGNALQVVSNDPTTTAVISEVAGGDTALLLGIGGGNVFTALDSLREALERNDTSGISASFENLNGALDTVLQARSKYGALVRTMDTLEFGHGADEANETAQLSAVEDSDFVKDASDVAALQFALEATLNTSARVLQPSLLDFLR